MFPLFHPLFTVSFMSKTKGYINYGLYADLIHQYVEYKRSLGFKMEDVEERLQRFDRMTVERKEDTIGITKSLFDEWSKIAPLESIANNYGRICILRRFSAYLQLMGFNSYIPKLPRYKSTFTPHIYTKQEMANIFRECDKLYCHRKYLYSSKCVMPCLIRLLYSTGIRINEALRLTHADVDIENGTLMLRECKNGQDRLIPLSLSMREICRDYMAYKQGVGLPCLPKDKFFTATDGRACESVTVYEIFRVVVYRAGLPHGGRGKGPRLHDLRHTFCVNSLVKMAEEGLDLYTSMPVLMTYMGHKSLSATNRYVRITEEMFPNLIHKVDETYKYIFPEIGTDPAELDEYEDD
jgi:integrase